MGLYSKEAIYILEPPHGKITPGNHGGYIVIMTWIMMSLMSLTILARLLTRIFPVAIYGWDDVAIAIGMIVAIVQSVVVHWAVNGGMGRHYSALDPHEFALYSKSNYASQILYTIALCLAKFSVLLFICRLTPSKEMRQVCRLGVGIVAAWGMSFATAFALQCKGPKHWNFSQQENCVDRSTLYCLFGTLDIITEIAMMCLPAFIVWKVHITRRQRWTVIGVFCSRITVCISTAFMLGTLGPYLKSDDQTWDEITPQIWMQVTQALSLTTACIPCLRPFLASLESGFLDSTMRSHVNKTYGSKSGSAAKGSFPGGSCIDSSNYRSDEGIELKAMKRGREMSRVALLESDNNLFTSRMASTSISNDAKKAKAALSALHKRIESDLDSGYLRPSRMDGKTIRIISDNQYQIPSHPLGSLDGESTRPLNDSADMVLLTSDELGIEAEHEAAAVQVRNPFGTSGKSIIRRARDSLESYREETLPHS